MKQSKLSALLEGEIKVVEKKKIFFLISAAIALIAVIFMIGYGFGLGSALNLGMDFTGGYSLSVKLGTKLTAENKDEFVTQITSIVEGLSDDADKSYELKVGSVQEQGSGDKASLYVKYTAPKVDEYVMAETVNPKLETELNEAIFRIIPSVGVTSGAVEVKYPSVITEENFNLTQKGRLSNALTKEGIAFTSITLEGDGKIIKAAVTGTLTAAQSEAVKSAMTITDTFSGKISPADVVSATVSSELLSMAIIAVTIALALMLIYIVARFELAAGLSAVIALFHDMLIMFCFMAIFHIEISSTFIAAIITILGYSINNTIVIFDRVREVRKSKYSETMSYAQIANRSIRDTLTRSIYTTLTTLVTIGMVAIIGVTEIRIFAIPIILGLLAGTYSSLLIAPALWTLISEKLSPRGKSKKKDAPTKSQDSAPATN